MPLPFADLEAIAEAAQLAHQAGRPELAERLTEIVIRAARLTVESDEAVDADEGDEVAT